jgi:nucleotide-binding universal stress UspA family protein
MYEKILIPLDGSDAAEVVLPYAVEISTKYDAEITIISVSGLDTVDNGHLYHSYQERIMKQVQRQLNDYGAKKKSLVHGEVLPGNPADEILRYANKKDISLIVMASHGSSTRRLWHLGNVAEKVLRATVKPVLLVRAQASREALRRKSLLKKIMVPLDGSKLGEATIPWIVPLAQALDAELVLFQVVEPVIFLAGSQGTPYALPDAMAYLSRVEKLIKETELNVSSEVKLGSAADQIIDYAEANSIDLIAMSTHGRSGIGRWVFGSITDKVLHAGDTAILVVRALTTEA